MKKLLVLSVVISMLTACNSKKSGEIANLPAGVHAILTEEVLQTSQYTYVKAKENDKSFWLAAPAMNAAVGDTFYFRDGLSMTNFNSKELNRTFDEVLFVDNLSRSSTIAEKGKEVAATSQLEQNLMDKDAERAAAANGATPSEGEAAVSHAIIAEEVLQANQYTYIKAKEGDQSFWVAVNKMNAVAGKTYYFQGGLVMTDFTSKELKKTFPQILFVDNISIKPLASSTNASANTSSDANAAMNANANTNTQSQPVSTGSAIPIEKSSVKIPHAKGDLTIASLYENKKSYSGKTVKLKGQVTKFTPGIMKRNWIHLQDGTDFSGKFDLTVTTTEELKVGDIISAEGSISLDKDFGYGYFYDVLMEDAKISK